MAGMRERVLLVAIMCCFSSAQMLEEQEVMALQTIIDIINEIKTTLEEKHDVVEINMQKMENKLSLIQDQMTSLQNCATVDQLEHLRNSVATEQNETRITIEQFHGIDDSDEVTEVTAVLFEGDCDVNGTFQWTNNGTITNINNLHLCEKQSISVTVSCEEGSEYFVGLCYHISSRKGTWQEGENYCSEMSASYAKINKPEEWAFVASRVKDSAWIGLMEFEKDGSYEWDFDPTYVYTNWVGGGPDNYEHNEHCIHYTGDAGYHWNDWGCHEESTYLCERDKNNEGCPADYLEFGESCYLFSYEKKSWWDAKEACKDMGAYFAKITSAAEDSFIRGHLMGHTWFGLSDLDEEGKFKWTKDGEVIYSSSKGWHMLQPESIGDVLDCPHLWKDKNYLLNDRLCHTQFNFVCTTEPNVRVV